MRPSRALHIAVANPEVRTYVEKHSSPQATDWVAIVEAVQSYAERSAEAVARTCAGFQIPSQTLTGRDATRVAVEAAFDRAVTDIGDAGLLVLSFAGHGRLQADFSDDETDGCDTAWMLFDVPLSDDDLRGWLHGVPAGCRVIVLGDCCRAGGMELAADLVCTSNPSAEPPTPPPSSRAYLSAVDKGSVWVPGRGDRTFAEEVEMIVSRTPSGTYRGLEAALDAISTINKRRIVRCRPSDLWDIPPFT